MKKVKPLILIPARYQSTRFVGKPLALINGIPMIQRVYQNLVSQQWDTYVVTDDTRITKCVESFGGLSCTVTDSVETGTDRIHLAYQRYFKNKGYDFIINLQGDEPLVSKDLILRLLNFSNQKKFDIVTGFRKRSSSEISDFYNKNIVKIALARNEDCLYFSRSPIPYSRKEVLHDWYQHIGVYGYKVSSLEKMAMAKESKLEGLECLEQLRALELGLKIGAFEIKETLIGVDTLEDIKKVERALGKRQ